MAPDKLSPNDSRVSHHTVNLNGKNYHYLLGNPSASPVATILLVHGWPDLSFGWRYQVPYLLSLRLRVIVPDLIGFGRTDAPAALPAYSLRSSSDDMAALARHVAGPETRIILGGHDWGGALAWRLALWHPQLIRAVFSVCTPYLPPSEHYVDPETLVRHVPNFAYQLHLAGPEVEARVVGRDKIGQLLRGVFGGRGPKGEQVFDTTKGVLFENLEGMGPSPLLSEEEAEFYTDEYARNGMRGPLNWYRTRKINYDDELELVKGGKGRIALPALMITATKDTALPPSMAAGMPPHFDNLVIKEVNSSHWALWQAADEVNALIGEFVKDVLAQDGVKASI